MDYTPLEVDRLTDGAFTFIALLATITRTGPLGQPDLTHRSRQPLAAPMPSVRLCENTSIAIHVRSRQRRLELILVRPMEYAPDAAQPFIDKRVLVSRARA